MMCSTVKKIAHVVHRRYHAKRQGSHWMFDVPNYSMHLTRKDACFVRNEMTLNRRRNKLIENLEARK